MKVKCISNKYSDFIKEKIYEVFMDEDLYPCIINDAGDQYIISENDHIFEVVQQDNLETSQKTLRDEFAMAAMQAFIRRYDGSRFPADIDFARWVYETVDAMLKVREENANTNE